MALTKTIIDDKIEIVTEFKHLQIRTATVIKEDGVEISRTFSRKTIQCGSLDNTLTNFVDTDISSESAEIQAICNAVWTTTIKDAWKTRLLADKSISP